MKIVIAEEVFPWKYSWRWKFFAEICSSKGKSLFFNEQKIWCFAKIISKLQKNVFIFEPFLGQKIYCNFMFLSTDCAMINFINICAPSQVLRNATNDLYCNCCCYNNSFFVAIDCCEVIVYILLLRSFLVVAPVVAIVLYFAVIVADFYGSLSTI